MTFEIDNIELYYSSKRILNGIYLKVETGRVVGLLGSNGCGKTSLLNIIFGNLKPKFKLIRIDNKPVLKPLYTTGIVKYLPQYNFIPDELKLHKAFKLFKLKWAHFETDFEEFAHFKDYKFAALSGGQRRLIETYIILKSDAELILLDEPFSHLAPLHIERIIALITIEKQRKAIIITDHMYRHIIDASDHIYLIKNGSSKLINTITELEDYKYLTIGSLN